MPEDLVRLLGYQRGSDVLGSWRDGADPITAVHPDRSYLVGMESMRTNKRHRARPRDTSVEAWRLQRDRLRAMTPAEKLAVCDEMSVDLLQMTEAGIKATEGDISNERLRWLLTKRRYGRKIAELACGAEPPR